MSERGREGEREEGKWRSTVRTDPYYGISCICVLYVQGQEHMTREKVRQGVPLKCIILL